MFYWTELNLVGICYGFWMVNLIYLYESCGQKLDFWMKVGDFCDGILVEECCGVAIIFVELGWFYI